MATSPLLADELRALLTEVVDPELGVDVVSLGMVPDITIVGGDVTVTIALTTMGCPLRAQLRDDVRVRLGAVDGVDAVHVEWTVLTDEGRAAAMSTARARAQDDAPDTAVPAATRVLAIASGKGGVGKSSVTVNLAAALAARGHRVGVLDGDIWGFSVPRLLGVAERLESVDGKIVPATRAMGDGHLEVVSMGLLVDDESAALMWRGLMLTRAVQHFLEDVRWGDLDYLLVDMPPGTGDVQMGLARMLPKTEVLVVTTPAPNAQRVAARAVSMARRSHLRVVGAIENMSDFTCEHGESYALFGTGGGAELAATAGVPLLGQIPIEPAVPAAEVHGDPVVLGDGLAATAFRTLAERIATTAAPVLDLDGCTVHGGAVATTSETPVELAAPVR